MKLSKTIVLVSILFGCAEVQADGAWSTAGSGVFGANRRVVTKREGYVGIRGSFSVPTIKIPTGNFPPTNLAGFAKDAGGNSANSKPGFYFGCSQGELDTGNGDPEGDPATRLEVDAGIIYEPRASTVGSGEDKSVLNPGYSIFLRATGDRTGSNNQPSFFANPADQWRACIGYPGSPNANVTRFDLTWRMYRIAGAGVPLPYYGGYLHTNAVGADIQPKDPIDQDPLDVGRLYARDSGGTQYIAYTTSGMAVKRVTAINQGGSNINRVPYYLSMPSSPNGGGQYEQDGSYMRGSLFSNGQVLKEAVVSGKYAAIGNQAWPALSTASIDQDPNTTGYYPPGKDQGSPLIGPAPITARYMIDYPQIPEPERDLAGDNSRYDNERININLRRGIKTKGNVVSPNAEDTFSIEN